MSKKNKKKQNNTPRRKRMKRPARLQNAKKWLPTYTGKNPIRGYARWYGVDALCAITELRLLGMDIPEEKREQALRTNQTKAEENQRRKERRKQEKEAFFSNDDSDDTFAMIAGYTSGGFAYGVTWEEMEEICEWEHLARQTIHRYSREPSDETFSHITGYTSDGEPYGIRWKDEACDQNGGDQGFQT
jgi:hypothetical protein